MMNSDIDARAHKAQPPLSDKKAIPSEKRQFGCSLGYPHAAKSFEPIERFRDDGSSMAAGNVQVKSTESTRDFRDRPQESFPFDSLRRVTPNSNFKERRNGEVEADLRNRRKSKNERDDHSQGRGTFRNTSNLSEAHGNVLRSKNLPMQDASRNYMPSFKASYPKQSHGSSSYKEYPEKWTETTTYAKHSMREHHRVGGRNTSPRHMEITSHSERTVLAPQGNPPLVTHESVRPQESALMNTASRNNGLHSEYTLHSPRDGLLPMGSSPVSLCIPPGNTTGERVAGGFVASLSSPISASPGEAIYTYTNLDRAVSQAGIMPAPRVLSSPTAQEMYGPVVSPLTVRETAQLNYNDPSSLGTSLHSHQPGSHSLSPKDAVRSSSPHLQDFSFRGISSETSLLTSPGKISMSSGSLRKEEIRQYGKRENETSLGGVGVASPLLHIEEGSRVSDPAACSSSGRSPRPISPNLAFTGTKQGRRDGMNSAAASGTRGKYQVATSLISRKAESAPKLVMEQSADDGWSDDGDGFGGDVNMVDIVGLKSKSPPADARLSTGFENESKLQSALSGTTHKQPIAAGKSEEDSFNFVKQNFSFTTSTLVSSTISQQRKFGTPVIPRDETGIATPNLGSTGKKSEEVVSASVESKSFLSTDPITSTIPHASVGQSQGSEDASGEKREEKVGEGDEPVKIEVNESEEGVDIRTRVESKFSGTTKDETIQSEQSAMGLVAPLPCVLSEKESVFPLEIESTSFASAVGTEDAVTPALLLEGKTSAVVNEDLINRDAATSLIAFAGGVTTSSATEEIESPPKSSGGAWRSSRRSATRTDVLSRQVKALLNKLTIEKFPTIIEKLAVLEEEVRQEFELVEMVNLVVGKAVLEPEWSEMYADLCIILNWRSPSFNETQQNLFRVALISKIQEEFQRLPKKLELSEEEAQGLDKAAIEQEIKKMKNHILGVVRLIGELFQRRLLAFRIVSSVIVDLVIDNENPHEHIIECFLQLICTIGYHIDQIPTLKSALDLWFGRLKELQNKDRYSKRLKCVIQDVLDLRKADWRKKIHKERAKALSAVRGQLEKEDCIGGATHAAQYGNIVVIGKPSNVDSSKSYGAYLEEQRQRYEMRKSQKA